MSFNIRRSPGTVGRGSISIITLLLALPKLLLLPSLAGAFLAPIGVLSTSAGRFSSSSSTASSPGQDRQAASLRNGRHQHQHQPPNGVGGLFALSGGASSDDSTTDKKGNMSPAEAGAAEGAAGAGTPLMSTPSLSGAVGGAGGDDAGDGGVTEKGGPAVVNVAKVEASSSPPPTATSTLWNVPNMLTMARVVAIPVFATIFYAALPRRNIWCSAIFAGAAFTDWLDGYIARRQGIVTPFGSFLDPVADKLLVSTALILLSERLGPWMTICSAIILCRELGISALREWMAQLGLRETVKVGNAGKWKTATQMIAISMLLLLEPGAAVTLVDPATFMPIAKSLLYVSTVLTVTSGSGYLKAAWPALMGNAK